MRISGSQRDGARAERHATSGILSRTNLCGTGCRRAVGHHDVKRRARFINLRADSEAGDAGHANRRPH